VPYKRYVLPLILALSDRYVSEPETSYRAAVAAQDDVPLGYVEKADGAIDERQMNHTTLWHWLTWLGNFTALETQALDLLRQNDPAFALHRSLIPIVPGKYRSNGRRCLLESAASLLRTGVEFMRRFSRRIFPTLCNRRFTGAG
jgi:hypothetical protein